MRHQRVTTRTPLPSTPHRQHATLQYTAGKQVTNIIQRDVHAHSATRVRPASEINATAPPPSSPSRYPPGIVAHQPRAETTVKHRPRERAAYVSSATLRADLETAAVARAHGMEPRVSVLSMQKDEEKAMQIGSGDTQVQVLGGSSSGAVQS